MEYYGQVAGKTKEEVKLHYQKLVEGIGNIQADLVPLPKYRETSVGHDSKARMMNKGKIHLNYLVFLAGFIP